MSKVAEIRHLVAWKFHITAADMMSKRRDRNVARARAVAMYLSRALLGWSYPVIGDAFKRDHSTVMHSVQVVEGFIEKSEEFGGFVDEMAEALEGP